jgi:hypothetical protein
MATAQASKPKVQVPNFYEPQPTVTIFITASQEPQIQQDEVMHPNPLGSKASTSINMEKHGIPNPKLPKYIFHRNLISHYSLFFAAAFKGNFKEGLSQEMTLEADVKVFGVFSNWLYTQKILDSKGDQLDLGTLADLWILADRFLVPVLQNRVVDSLYDKLNSGREKVSDFLDFCKVADEHAEGDNPLALLAASLLTWSPPGSLDRWLDQVPRSILIKSWQTLKTVQVPEGQKGIDVQDLYVRVNQR